MTELPYGCKWSQRFIMYNVYVRSAMKTQDLDSIKYIAAYILGHL